MELAWREGRVIGGSRVWPRPDARTLTTGLIGVRRVERGRGALAGLRASHCLRLKSVEFHTLVNQSMEYRGLLNKTDSSLGFTVVRAWVEVKMPAAQLS